MQEDCGYKDLKQGIFFDLDYTQFDLVDTKQFSMDIVQKIYDLKGS